MEIVIGRMGEKWNGVDETFEKSLRLVEVKSPGKIILLCLLKFNEQQRSLNTF